MNDLKSIFESATKSKKTDKAIESTMNYDKFSILKENREIDYNKVVSIADSWDRNISKANPIIVNRMYEIIDGQHRYVVCKTLKEPIYYVVGDNLNIKHAVEMNRRKSDWNTLDFIESHAKRGNKSYKWIYNLMIENKLSVKTLVGLLNDNTRNIYSIFKSGEYILTEEGKQTAIYNLKCIRDFEPFFAKWRTSWFLIAFVKLNNHKNYKHDYMIKKLDFCQGMLHRSTSVKEYYEILVHIYNYKIKNSKNKISFL